jgi:drug/metabolite transporter (DMT)-like permease
MSPAHPFRGPAFMLLATGSYVINDTMMKIATEGLPPYQVLVMRGIAAVAWGLPLLLVLGYGRQLPLMFEILGASVLLGERIGGMRMALISVGFAGAVMVAQPTGAGISIYALLALGNAIFCAVRDLVGRGISPDIPGMVVALSAAVVVLVVSAVVHLLFETFTVPDARNLMLLGGAGFFLIFGHFFIFMAYRTGPTQLVAPFYYSFTLWAVISGVIVFGYLPNRLAIAGILLVLVSGLAVIHLDGRRRRLSPAA